MNPQAVPVSAPDPTQVASQRLTTPSGRHSHALGGPKPKKRRNKKPYSADDSQGGNRGGRVILPASSASAGSGAAGPSTAGGPVPKQPRARKKLKNGRKSVPSEGRATKQGGPAKSSHDKRTAAPPQQQDDFVAVATRTGETAFTRPRGDALNSSIASVLGRRPAELLEEHERELRTKRQKTAADALRSAMLAASDDEDEELPGPLLEDRAAYASKGEVFGEILEHAETRPPAQGLASAAAPDRDMTDADDEAEGLLIVEAAEHFSAAEAGPRTEDAAVRQELSSHAPPLPGTVESGGQRDHVISVPARPGPARASTNVAPKGSTTSAVEVNQSSRAGPAAAFSDLPKALPVLHGAQPKLTSAASILAGKRRKKKPLKLKRAPQLFDYLSDELSDDWEPKADKYKAPKRPKNGRAVDGRLEIADDDPKDGQERPASGSVASDERTKLVPTSYQAALLERAKASNILTVLSTGAGKTLVAVLLIEYLHAQEALRLAGTTGTKRRMIFFLTNSVPLVHQQADVLARK